MAISIPLPYLSDIDFSPVQIGWGYHHSRTQSLHPLCEHTTSQCWVLPFQVLTQRPDPFQEWGKQLSHRPEAFSCREHTYLVCMLPGWILINIEDSRLTIKSRRPGKRLVDDALFSLFQNIPFSFSSNVSSIFTCSWGMSFHFTKKGKNWDPVSNPS